MQVEWIGLRSTRLRGAGSQAPTRSGPVTSVASVSIGATGLDGDRYARVDGDRAVTLFDSANLASIAAALRLESIDPAQVRRNILVGDVGSGKGLLDLVGREFRIGDATLLGTGSCHPCRKMNETVGPGAFEAMRGLGGITARVVKGGLVSLGDAISVKDDK